MTAQRTETSESAGRYRAILLFAGVTGLLLLLCLAFGQYGPIGESIIRLPGLPPIYGGGAVLLYAVMWFVGLAIMLVWPRGLSSRSNVALMLVLAATARALLLPAPPSDDINRYLWEGKLVRAGISPYAMAPDSAELAPMAAADPFHAQVNHPDMPAAYPPLVLQTFAIVGAAWYHPMAYKLLIVLFDLATLWGILLLLRHRHLSPRWAILYAFNPLVLISFAGHGHFDAMQGACLIGALCLYDRRHWAACFLMAGLAIQTKYVAVLAVPFLLRRDNWRYAPLLLVTALAPYLPLLLTDPRQLLYCVVAFGEEFAFNGCVHGLLRPLFGGELAPAATTTKIMLLITLCLGYAWLHPARNPRHRNDPVAGMLFALGALLVLSPTVHLWYLTWIIPLLCIRPMSSWFVLTLTASLTFLASGHLCHEGRWYLPGWAQLLEWLPFALLLTREGIQAYFRQRAPGMGETPNGVSVVIPTLNEVDRITRCIDAVRGDPAVREIVVVDGGSTDGTATRAMEAGARVIRHERPLADGGGRGGQIQAGLLQAHEDVVAIVHADTRIHRPAMTEILTVLQRQPMLVGGALGTVFDSDGWGPTLLTVSNDGKGALLGISFGDQVQFFLRRPVLDTHSFPALPLMEDLELAIRLKRLGATTHLFGDGIVSSRDWKTGGLKRMAMVMRLLATYCWQRIWSEPDVLAMYRRYYGPETDGGRRDS